ncbi:uncharacterized protein MELLADRAFT_108578 [Melampsora larici-populina 98AG31]|uniref:Uncharacterized protein n=1 Tax=Melampsora larici-populina (strain 98AG31 / pathotype 3-4-7) TaxID=747676 RepID=F4RTJ6_MELLP|nr:uncharacterized protein MELLADRAFT_108578 [Melampsora larici-populina 98AG31]EGG04267.1 hypothetical protein MELLADRAFT_108578 [Melampsora larici-populina 98AG31]
MFAVTPGVKTIKRLLQLPLINSILNSMRLTNSPPVHRKRLIWPHQHLTPTPEENLNTMRSNPSDQLDLHTQDTSLAFNINVLLLSVSASCEILRVADDLVHRVSKRVRNNAIVRSKMLQSPRTNNPEVRITLHVLILLPHSLTFTVEAAAHLDTLRSIPNIILRIHPIVTIHPSGYRQTIFRALHTGQLGEIVHTLSQAAFVLSIESTSHDGNLDLSGAFVDVITQLLCSHLALQNATRFKWKAMLGRPTISVYLATSQTTDEHQLADQTMYIARHSARVLNDKASAYSGAAGLGQTSQNSTDEAKRPNKKPPPASARPRTANVSTSTPSHEPIPRPPTPELLRTAPGASPVFLVARLDCGIELRVFQPDSPNVSVFEDQPIQPSPLQSDNFCNTQLHPHPGTESSSRPHRTATPEGLRNVTPALQISIGASKLLEPNRRAHLPPKSSLRAAKPPIESTVEQPPVVQVLEYYPEKAYRLLGHGQTGGQSHYVKSASLRTPSPRQASEHHSPSLHRSNMPTERPPAGMVFPDAQISPISSPSPQHNQSRSRFVLPTTSLKYHNGASTSGTNSVYHTAATTKFNLPPRPTRSGARPRTAPTSRNFETEPNHDRKATVTSNLARSQNRELERSQLSSGLSIHQEYTNGPPGAMNLASNGEGLQRRRDLASLAFETQPVPMDARCQVDLHPRREVGELDSIMMDESQQMDVKYMFDRQARNPDLQRPNPMQTRHDISNREGERESSTERQNMFSSTLLSRFNSIRSTTSSQMSGSVYSPQHTPTGSDDEDDETHLMQIADLLNDRRKRADLCSVAIR